MRPLAAGILAAALVSLTAATADADPTVAEPPDYRMEEYRAAVPDVLTGATVIDAQGVVDWQARGAVLIDVLPSVKRPEGLPEGTLWHVPQHESLPGAVWLADTGYGQLAPEVEQGFETDLARLSHDDKAAPLVFFCKADCWMSWNAARRAVQLGYAKVAWFPGGTDDWAAEGHDLAPVTPAN